MIAPWLELDNLIAADPVKGAYFSQRARTGAGEPMFRCALWRIWDNALPLLAVMGLNPSTAGATSDDMTTTKITGFAQRKGYGGYILGNLYTYCATDPMQLMQVGTKNAEGYGNKEWIEAIVTGRDCLVAWGVVGIDPQHLLDVEHMIWLRAVNKFCLGYTQGGYPRHPSRIGYDTPWEEWVPARRAIA